MKKMFPRPALVLAALLSVTAPTGANAAVPVVTLRQIATGLSLPVEAVAVRDGTGRLFVVEQNGRIRIVKNGSVLATPFLDVSGGGVISAGGERGLLGLAFHPNYASNGAFYVYYTRAADGALVVARYLRSAGNADVADPTSRAELLAIPHSTYANHNGGHIAFGPDGHLYVGTGDGGSGGDPDRNGLNLSSRLGKLLRIAVDGGAGYTIPAGNPYAGQTCTTACPEIWAYGLRNPWKFSFDRVDGDLFIGDVGQGAVEEVDVLPSGAAGGTNFGWGVYEGNTCYNDTYFGPAGACAAQSGHTRPVLTYGHDANGGVAITGGFRYRGRLSAEFEGFYVYGDYSSRRIWAARQTGPGTFSTEVLLPPPGTVAAISSFAEDENGELILVDYGNGKLWAMDGPALALTSVTARATHAGAGSLGIDLPRDKPLSGAIAIDPRLPEPSRRIELAFSAAPASTGTITVRDAAGAVLDTPVPSISGGTVAIGIQGIGDARRVRVEVQGLNGTGARIVVPVGFLVGDVGATGLVSAADIAAIKARQGQSATPSSTHFDLDRSGVIDAADLAIAKSRSGTRLP